MRQRSLPILCFCCIIIGLFHHHHHGYAVLTSQLFCATAIHPHFLNMTILSIPVAPAAGLFVSLVCWHWPRVVARWVVDTVLRQHTQLPLIDALRLCLLRNAQEWLPNSFIQVHNVTWMTTAMITHILHPSLPQSLLSHPSPRLLHQPQATLVNNAHSALQKCSLAHTKITIPFPHTTPLEAYWFASSPSALPPPANHTILLWLHGGYYLFGCATMHAHAFDAWLRHAGVARGDAPIAVLSVEYTRTPEVAFPHALQQSMC